MAHSQQGLGSGARARSHGAQALMVDNSHRSQIAGIDLITYRTNVRDVVSILGALPAGDAMAAPAISRFRRLPA